jgi:signal transduction histidine kinase
VVKHAGATAAAITVTGGKDVAVAEITDDGGLLPGLAASAPAPAELRLRRAGSGLAGLAERIRQLGGELTAGPRQPHGFRLRVSIPVGEGR